MSHTTPFFVCSIPALDPLRSFFRFGKDLRTLDRIGVSDFEQMVKKLGLVSASLIPAGATRDTRDDPVLLQVVQAGKDLSIDLSSPAHF